MEGRVRYSDGARETHINFPIHGEDQQIETNIAAGEAEAQETSAVNGGGQQSQSGAQFFGLGTGNDEQIVVQSGAPGSEIGTINDEERPALAAATGFAERYTQLFNLDELRRWDRILVTDDEVEISEAVRAIRPRIFEEETDEEDDGLIEMMMEYVCDRVEIDEVTDEEEKEKPTCAICREGLHFVEDNGNENADVLSIVYHVPTCFTLTAFQNGYADRSPVPFVELNFGGHSYSW